LAQALVPACWTPPPQIYYELKPRLAQRASLLEWRTQVSNQLHALSVAPVVVPAVRERLVQLIDIVNQHIAKPDAELLELVKIEQEPSPEEEIQRVILNFSTCETAEAATHYLGLAAIVRSSGTSVRGHAQIGHGGHARARTHLYLATLAAARFNPIVKRYYNRLREAGKPMKVARCACARKLLHIALAVVKSEQVFDAHYQATAKREAALGA
jgi:transposase